jgi:hypothetical protein
LIRSALPLAVASCIDWTSITRVERSFVDQLLVECHADLLFEARTSDGHRALVYLLLEHKSTKDPDTPFQLLRYVVRIWEHWREQHPTGLLPPILPFVLHHGATPWVGAPRLLDRVALRGLPEPLAGF